MSGSNGRFIPSIASNRSCGKHLLNAGLAALAAGFAASLMAAALMGVLRLKAGIPTPLELFSDHVLKLLPAGRFVQFLITFGRNAKTEPLGPTLLGMIGLGTLLGLLYAPLVRLALPASGYWPARREWLVAAGLAIMMTLIAVVLFWGEPGQNFLGLPLEWAMLVTGLAWQMNGVVLPNRHGFPLRALVALPIVPHAVGIRGYTHLPFANSIWSTREGATT